MYLPIQLACQPTGRPARPLDSTPTYDRRPCPLPVYLPTSAACQRIHLAVHRHATQDPPGFLLSVPRFVLRLRRRANARFTRGGQELFPVGREPQPKLAYPGNLEGHLLSHRSASERNFVIGKFLDGLQTPLPLESPTITCPNQTFYLKAWFSASPPYSLHYFPLPEIPPPT